MKNIAVIGAGPAGSVAAIRLARLGHHVTVFEKAPFPRNKVCGECLSALGISVLRRIGVADELARTLQPTLLRRASAVATDGSATSATLPEPMWGLTRASMDHWLASAADRAGATVRFGESADIRSIIEAVSPAGLDALGTAKASSLAGYDHILLADGVGRSLERAAATGDFGIKAHFRDVDAARDTIELVALSAGYAGLAPVNDGLWNAAWSVPASSLKWHGGDVDALFRHELARSITLRRRFARASRVGEWLACPLPRYAVRRHWPDRVIPIGNAAAALEPVGGEGMGLAMRSAELAADAIDLAGKSNRSVNTIALRRSFDRLWRRRAACRAGAVAMSHPVLGPLAVGIASRSSAITRAGLALVGK